MRPNQRQRGVAKTGLILILAAAGMFFAGCGGRGRLPAPDEGGTDRGQVIPEEGYNHFVNASLLELLGAYDQAANEYEKALKFFPASPSVRTDYARLLFRSQRAPEALQVATPIEPKTSEIYLLIGDCHRLSGDQEAAVENYRKAVALDSTNINAYWYIAAYFRQTEQIDSAIAAYYHLARLSETFRIWQELGTMLGRSGRYQEALDVFRWAVALNSEKGNINSYLGLAATYDAMDSLTQAEAALQQAVSLDPYDVRIFRQMMAMYLGRRDTKKAIAACERVVALVPTDWVAQRRLGVLLYSDSQLDRADSLFHSRLDFGDDNSLNYFYLGRVAVERNRLPEAKELFTTVTQKESSFADGWLNLGFVCRELDSVGRAIEIFEQGLQNCPEKDDQTRLLFSLGSAQERNGQFEGAVASFQKLLVIDSVHAPALNYLGYMLADRGEQLTYATQLIERALKISPDNGAYIDSYAWVQFKLGNLELALTELKKAAELITGDAVIYEHLGDIYRAMGNDSEATRNYQHALEIDPGNAQIQEKLKK